MNDYELAIARADARNAFSYQGNCTSNPQGMGGLLGGLQGMAALQNQLGQYQRQEKNDKDEDEKDGAEPVSTKPNRKLLLLEG